MPPHPKSTQRGIQHISLCSLTSVTGHLCITHKEQGSFRISSCCLPHPLWGHQQAAVCPDLVLATLNLKVWLFSPSQPPCCTYHSFYLTFDFEILLETLGIEKNLARMTTGPLGEGSCGDLRRMGRPLTHLLQAAPLLVAWGWLLRVAPLHAAVLPPTCSQLVHQGFWPCSEPQLGESRVSALPGSWPSRERGWLYFKLLSGSAGTLWPSLPVDIVPPSSDSHEL